MRDERGRFIATEGALDRFLKFCQFEPETGCVIWTGYVCAKGYGRFHYEGRHVLAHRWAAVYIHGLDVGELTVHHNCPHTGNGHPETRCVRHVEVLSLAENIAERNVRLATCRQSKDQLKFWAFVDRGLEPAPPRANNWIREGLIFSPPKWLDNSPELPYPDFAAIERQSNGEYAN